MILLQLCDFIDHGQRQAIACDDNLFKRPRGIRFWVQVGFDTAK